MSTAIAQRDSAPAWLAAILPGLRGEASGPGDRRSTELQYRAGLVGWSATAPALSGVAATDLATPGLGRRTVVDVMPEIPAAGLFQVPQLTGGVAAPHAIGSAKQEAGLAFGGANEKFASIASYVRVSDELLQDAAGLEAWLQAFLAWLVKTEEQREILAGNGTPPNLQGLLTRTAIPTYVGGATAIADVVAGMIGQVLAAPSGMVPDGIALSPGDFGALITAGVVASDTDPVRLYGCDVFVSTGLGAGQVIVGAFQTAAAIGRNGGITLAGTQSHDTDFTHNISAIRAQSRIALGVMVPNGFVRKVA